MPAHESYQLILRQRNDALARIAALEAQLAEPAGREDIKREALCALLLALPALPESWGQGTVARSVDVVLSAVAPLIAAAERERCAGLAGSVCNNLAANGADCLCGNGRVPVTAYRAACDAFAAAIRRGEGG